jgi:hypothetical protein
MVDRERAYDAVRNVVIGVTKRPEKRALKERGVKTSLVAHGELSVDEYATAVRALDEQGVIVRGSGWVSPVVDGAWLTEAVEYVVDRHDGKNGPQAFVASVNAVK